MGRDAAAQADCTLTKELCVRLSVDPGQRSSSGPCGCPAPPSPPPSPPPPPSLAFSQPWVGHRAIVAHSRARSRNVRLGERHAWADPARTDGQETVAPIAEAPALILVLPLSPFSSLCRYHHQRLTRSHVEPALDGVVRRLIAATPRIRHARAGLVRQHVLVAATVRPSQQRSRLDGLSAPHVGRPTTTPRRLERHRRWRRRPCLRRPPRPHSDHGRHLVPPRPDERRVDQALAAGGRQRRRRRRSAAWPAATVLP